MGASPLPAATRWATDGLRGPSEGWRPGSRREAAVRRAVAWVPPGLPRAARSRPCTQASEASGLTAKASESYKAQFPEQKVRIADADPDT